MRYVSSIVAAFVLVAILAVAAAEVFGSSQTTDYDLGQDRAQELIVYSATWCGPCQALKPTLLRLKAEGYKVGVKDVDRDELKFKYRSVPTLFYCRDGKPIETEVGRRSYDHIKGKLWKP